MSTGESPRNSKAKKYSYPSLKPPIAASGTVAPCVVDGGLQLQQDMNLM